jgi:hypothetical protein
MRYLTDSMALSRKTSLFEMTRESTLSSFESVWILLHELSDEDGIQAGPQEHSVMRLFDWLKCSISYATVVRYRRADEIIKR